MQGRKRLERTQMKFVTDLETKIISCLLERKEADTFLMKTKKEMCPYMQMYFVGLGDTGY